MFLKNYFLVFILTFFVAGFFFLVTPEISFSQDGCCINNGGNCVGQAGSCGPQGSSCQNEQFGPCNDPPGTFVLGETCFQVTASVGECQPIGCCQIEQGNCFQTSSGTCATGGNTFLGPGACQPQFDPECSPLGCCQDEPGQPLCQQGVTQLQCGTGTWTQGVSCSGDVCGVPPPPTGCCQTMPNGPVCTPDIIEAQCSGTWTEGDIVCDGNFCGQAPIGCCQIEAGVCDEVTEANCQGTFFEAGMCPESGFCEPPPQGCCVCSNGVTECTFTTEFECDNMGCDYQGDNVPCSAVDECNVEPEGCCVLGIEDCVITTESSCDSQNGDYQGDGVSCDGIPECTAPITMVPTIGQWGMIAMAGLLGLFSLFIIIRRHRYNVG